MRRLRGCVMAGAIVASVGLVMSGCAKHTESIGPGGSTTAVKPARVDEIANLLPDTIRQAEKIVVGTDPTSPPSEYKDSNGKIVGFDVDLFNAVAAVLGVTADYRESPFDKIFPSVQGGTYDVGMSSFTDNKQREQQLDFVDYFQAGSLWAQRTGLPVDPNNACGKKVSVQTGTVQDDNELPAKNDACVKAGKPPIEVLRFEGQDEATDAVRSGRVDAMTADYPVTAYATKNSDGKLQAAGELFKTAPYGWVVQKNSPLSQALLKALEHVIQTGDYNTVLANWQLQDGAVQKAVINGALN